jgi:Fe-S cluster assembly iron-binding protein IscA
MLTLTGNAISAIRSLTSQQEPTGETGLRLMAQSDGVSPFQLFLTEGPMVGDQVVEEDGARVFVEATVAAALDDKALDVQVNDRGDLDFCISDQADTT